jgi:hypothetical protein
MPRVSNELRRKSWRRLRWGTVDQQTAWVFRVNAVTNLVLAARGVFDPNGTAAAFGEPAPNYPFLIRLWSGLVLMFGLMFWETSRDVRGKAALIKYNWIEKTITATAVTLGYTGGDVSARLMLLIVFTNWLWIPIVLSCDLRLRRELRSHPQRPRGAPPRADEAASAGATYG